MGRAIDQDNRLDGHDSRLNDYERRLKLVEDALEEMVHTRVHHVDLHDMDKEYIDKLKDEKLKEEEFTPPVGKRKRTTKVEKRSTEKSNAEA